MNKKILIALSAVILLSAQAGWAGDDYAGKKIFFINSYHDGYAWSDGIKKGEAAEVITYRFAMQALRRGGANA